MTISRAWLIKTVELGVLVAAGAFLSALVAGGANFSVPVLHAAIEAGYGAAITFAQSVVAGLLNPPAAPPTASAPAAFMARLRTGKGPVDPPMAA